MSPRFGLALALVLALALALRLAAVSTYDRGHPQADRPVIDEESYERWALEIAGGDWLGDAVFFQEPLYPYALALAYAAKGGDAAAGRRLVRRAQAALGALTAVLVALLARELFDARAGLVAGVLWATYGPAVWMSCLLLKPNLFLPLLTLLALSLVRARVDSPKWLWLAVGALVGCGALLRGNLLLLAPAFCLWPLARTWLERRAWRPALGSAALVAAGVALVLLPVALRNRAVGGRLVLSTSGAGTNVYGGNNADNPYGIAKEFDWVRGVPAFEAADWRHEAERRLGRELDASETSAYWLAETGRSIVRDPTLHLSILWNKLRGTLGGYEVPDNHCLPWDARYVPLLRWLPGFALAGGLGLFGLLLLWNGRAERRVVAALFVLYLATIVLTVTSARVRLALVPLLLPFAGGLVAAAPGAVVARPWRAGAAALVALSLVVVPVLPADKRAEDLDERDFNLAGQRLDEGDLDGAEPVLRDLARRHPRSARVARRLSELEYLRALPEIEAAAGDRQRLMELQGRVESVLARLATLAEGSNPRERFRATALAGAILQDQGQWDRAAAAFGAALEFDPEDTELRRRRALCLAESALLAPSVEERRAGLERSLALLERLLADTGDASLEDLIDQIRGRL